MLQNELYKIISRTEKRGFREGLRYVRGQIYSTSKYYVFRHNMDKIPDMTSQFNNFRVIEIPDPDCALFGEIYRVCPSETRPNDEKYIKELLRERSKNGIMCFVLLHKDHLAGANWLSRPNHYYSNLAIPYLPDEYISYWTFIVSSYRGMGASKLLKSSSLCIAKQKEISSVISISSVKNTPSIRMNLGIGYKIIGTFTEQRRLFQYRQHFMAMNSKV